MMPFAGALFLVVLIISFSSGGHVSIATTPAMVHVLNLNLGHRRCVKHFGLTSNVSATVSSPKIRSEAKK